MKFLVDTNILSEPTKPQPNPQVEKWITDHEADFYTSSLVMAELLNGLEKLPESERKRRLARQIEKLVEKFGGRILSFNLRVAREWVRLQAELRSKAHLMPWEDSLIAATAPTSRIDACNAQYSGLSACKRPSLRPVHPRRKCWLNWQP